MERQDESLSKEFESIDERTRLAIAFQSTAETGAIALFHHYETSMRRSWDRALDRLESMRASDALLVPHPGEQADADSPIEPSPTNEQQP